MLYADGENINVLRDQHNLHPGASIKSDLNNRNRIRTISVSLRTAVLLQQGRFDVASHLRCRFFFLGFKARLFHVTDNTNNIFTIFYKPTEHMRLSNRNGPFFSSISLD